VACAKCHKEIVSGTTRYTQYKFNSIKCADCHLQ
jgi:hydrogenase maturation factor HypF (carbamoyltransferase family)